MEAVALSKLIAQVEAQLLEVEACYKRVEARAADMLPSRTGTVEALAYQLHNLYNAVEDLLKLVATAFENHIDDSTPWHKGLVHQLSLTIEGVRPPLVSKEALPLLDELRRFRHYFRHSYGAVLQADRILDVLNSARTAIQIFTSDVHAFTVQLRALRDSMG